jgi:hypothetical protein
MRRGTPFQQRFLCAAKPHKVFQNLVERRAVVHVGVPDTIVTVDNRRTANVTVVQIARADNETEPGLGTEATFFEHSTFLEEGGEHPCGALAPSAFSFCFV